MTEKQWDLIRADYVASAVRADQYPQPAMEEVAFVGRSNVGKSSLINSLTRRRGLARVSGSPGKTQTLNFYGLHAKLKTEYGDERKEFHLVDLPGYGFAKTSKDNRSQWSVFIRKYLTNSENLHLVCQLVDIRHAPMASDLEAYRFLVDSGVNVLVVLTKSDKLSKSAIAKQKNVFKRALGLDDSRIIAYTSTHHTMRNPLINIIMDYVLMQNEKIK